MAFAVVAILTTGVLFFLGTGLEPRWFLTWFAPLPVLLLVPRLTGKLAAVAAFVGYLVGTLNIAEYYLNVLEIPPPLALGIFAITSAIFSVASIMFRSLVLRRRPLFAVLTFGSVLAGSEYVLANILPGGANWSLAPTQAEFLPVLQTASLGGIWAVSFLVSAIPAAMAVVLAGPVLAPSARLRVGLVAVFLMASSLSYGVVQLGKDSDGQSVGVTLIASHLPAPEPILDVGTSEGRRLLQGDLAALASVPARTKIVVFPEKDLLVDEKTADYVSRQFVSAARDYGMSLVVGVEMHTDKDRYNEAHVYSPDGSRDVYRKQFMLPGVEDGLTTGHHNGFIRGYAQSVGVAICADMGHPKLGRSYAVAGAQLMVVPALDFTKDALSQSRVQYLRGVENGYSVARAARLGYLTLSDTRGRVVSQAVADTGAPFSMISAEIPVRPSATLYRRWGDWFAWLTLAIAVAGAVAGLTRFRASVLATKLRVSSTRDQHI